MAQLVETLTLAGAMDYTIVVSASANELASTISRFTRARCAMGEYFMDKGGDVLIIYDDLFPSVPVAYRALFSAHTASRPAAKTHPGDVFTFHDRHLGVRRAAAECSGGGLTALPIHIETQAGDVSACTSPQTSSPLRTTRSFGNGGTFPRAGVMLPSNPGISDCPARGHNAQIKAMKKVAGTLKLAYYSQCK